MATNFGQNPFSIFAYPYSGSLKTGSDIELISFRNQSPFYTSSNQGDLGGIALSYSNLNFSSSVGNPAGASADLIFKIASKERLDKKGTEVFRISATGSSNSPRIGIGDFSSANPDAILHVRGDTIVEDGKLKFTKKGETDIEITKDDLRDLVRGVPVADTSEGKNAARGGIVQTLAANALVNLADSSTLLKANETGKLELKANNLTLVEVDATTASAPVVNIGDKPAGKVLMTGSLEVTGSNVTFDVEDLLTLLGNFGQTGSFAVSGSSDFTGDVNMDGSVTVTDLLSVVAGFGATGSNNISGSLVINDNHSGTALSITGSTNVSGSSVFTGSFTASGSVFLDGATTVTDILNAIAGFEVSGSSTLSGSMVLTGSFNSDGDVIVGGDITASRFIATSVGSANSPNFTFDTDPDSGIYMPAPNNLHVQVGGGSAELQLNSTTTKIYNGTRVHVETPTTKITSSLIELDAPNLQLSSSRTVVSSSQIDFVNLPTSDPGIAGRLYTQTGAQLGFTTPDAVTGSAFVLISQ